MSLLNSNYSNFVVLLPPDFVPDPIKQKYTKFIKRLPIPFDNVTDFLNFTIQSMSWPEIQAQHTEQSTKEEIKSYKGGWLPHHYATREFEIVFKTTESFLNYFIFNDIFMDYWGNEDKNTYKTYMPDLTLHLIDNTGFILVSYKFNDVVFTGLGPLELSYSQNVPEFKTFNCLFKYKNFEIIDNFD